LQRNYPAFILLENNLMRAQIWHSHAPSRIEKDIAVLKEVVGLYCGALLHRVDRRCVISP
jgi:hypothetical protein